MNDKTKIMVIGGAPIGMRVAQLLQTLDRVAVVDSHRDIKITSTYPVDYDRLSKINQIINAPASGPRRKRGKGNKYHR